MKRILELRDLSDDHHTGLVLARRCKLAGRPNSAVSHEVVWKQVVEAFADHLEPHFLIEEQHLLPALEAISESSLVNRIREDHSALRALRDAESPVLATVQRFGELLESHIRFEERQVFQPTQERLPASALKAIAAACQGSTRSRPASSGQ
ncbi:MAG: hemerythrin domain-containing protein [bacterium]|nr:hemerythrin domain-containing protein [bacterium]